MIACLTGSLFQKTTERIIIDVGGVGYDVAFCQSGLGLLPEVGEDVFVYIYTKVRRCDRNRFAPTIYPVQTLHLCYFLARLVELSTLPL